MKCEENKKSLVLFGAGNNCKGVIKFIGKENIAVIIDNDSSRWGTEIDGIEVVSLENYLKMGIRTPILVTVIINPEIIRQQLERAGLTDIYYAPAVNFGFYEDVEDLIFKLKMDKEIPVFWGNNPMTEIILSKLKQYGFYYQILDVEERNYKVLNREKHIECLAKIEELTIDKKVFVTDAEEHDFSLVNNIIINIEDEYRKFLPFVKELEKFKGIHKGKRCFLIGNGPSLKMEDLELLWKKQQICFGANRIYLCYDKTNWRPDYYIMADSFMLEKYSEEAKEYIYKASFWGNVYSQKWKKKERNHYNYFRCPNKYKNNHFSTDITQYVYGGHTVIYDAMQIAVYMGFAEIILLGVDMTITKPGEVAPHFYESTEGHKVLNTLGAMKAFSIAEEMAKKEGIRILNATRGGNLDVFERVGLEDIFNK